MDAVAPAAGRRLNRGMPLLRHPDLPRFVAFGEALTDLIRVAPDQWLSRCGGAPWNVARAMSSLGELAAFAGGLSADVFGQAQWRESADANLDLRFLQQNAHGPLLAVVHETQPPQYFFIGENSADLHFRPEALPAGWMGALRWAFFGSISLVRPPLAERLLALAERLKAQGKLIAYDPNYRLLMDAGYDETLERMCRLADVIKVSDEDLCGLFRVPDPRVGLAQISAWNPRALLLLTQGERGARLFHPQGELHGRPPPVVVVDSVGAGDAAVAGLLHALMQGERAPEQWLRWALAAGSAACEQPGAQAPRADRVRALLDGVQILPAP